jgi:signal transduction histidine kinase
LPEVQRRDRDACNALFAALLEQNPHSATIGATDSKGRLFASAPAPPGPVNYADRIWFRKVIQTRDLVVGGPVVGRISGRYGNNLAYPIWDGEGRFQGTLTTQFNLEWLGSLLAKSDFPPTTAMVLTDSSRKVIFRYPEPQKYIGKMLPDVLIKALTNSDEGVAAGVGLPGDKRLFAFARLSPPWQEMWVLIGLPRDWAVDPVNRALWRNLIWLGLVAIFAMAAAWYGGDLFIVRPVKKLQAVTGQMAAGDLRVRAGPDYPVGELGLLACSFDQMADSLQEREEDLGRAKDELEQRVQERTGELRAANEQLLREVEDRHLAEEQALGMGRLYRLLSRVNEMIVRAREPEWLFRQACQIIMEEGYFLFCWVGLVDREAGLVRVAAQYDLADDYPQHITISLEDVPEGRGPTGVAVREGRWDVCLDIAGDPRMAPWRESAVARGFQSSAAFPLFVSGKIEAVLTLYSGKIGFFNTQEVELLNALAQDLSFAMESMGREAGRRKAEEEILRLNEELEQRIRERTTELEFANRELESFSYSVSHDLKAPIRAIQGFSRMLVGEHAAQLNTEGVRLLNVITSNTKFMAALIDDLLALSRLGRQEIRKASINLTAMARQIFEQLQSQEPERDLQFIIKDLPPSHGDPSLIKQVMVNLLTNAAKYTKPKKTAVIEVGGKDEEKENIYYVQDNGIGFDERYADKLFGVFQRLHSSEEYEGTGVGLAIVERIIERHGGRVWAAGKVDEGATFYFTLPKNGD